VDRHVVYGTRKNSGKKKLSPLDISESKETLRKRLEKLRKVYIDGTEQVIRRPSDKIEQRANYSGKKKDHTSKILLISGPDKRIEAMSGVYVGSTHDFSIFKEEKVDELLSVRCPVYIDTGFEGIKKLCPKANIKKPKKKPKRRKLNGGEKLGNRIISRERVKVEHAIGGMKKFKISSQAFRGITFSMSEVFKVTAGLWNLHVDIKRSNCV
jgi:hypothetical protein